MKRGLRGNSRIFFPREIDPVDPKEFWGMEGETVFRIGEDGSFRYKDGTEPTKFNQYFTNFDEYIRGKEQGADKNDT